MATEERNVLCILSSRAYILLSFGVFLDRETIYFLQLVTVHASSVGFSRLVIYGPLVSVPDGAKHKHY